MKGKIKIRNLLLSTLMLCAVVLVFSDSVYANAKAREEYVFYDMSNWRRYISSEAPRCSHREIGYRYVEAQKHAIFCRDCGVIFCYEDCYFINDKCSSTTDVNYNRCQICLHKQPVPKYQPAVAPARNYID